MRIQLTSWNLLTNASHANKDDEAAVILCICLNKWRIGLQWTGDNNYQQTMNKLSTSRKVLRSTKSASTRTSPVKCKDLPSLDCRAKNTKKNNYYVMCKYKKTMSFD